MIQVFEDNLAVWMDGYHHLLTLPDPIKALFVQGDDEKLTSMHQMQRSICEAILLYADKVIRDSKPIPLFIGLRILTLCVAVYRDRR